jgi:SAM-dependent methyltransferase
LLQFARAGAIVTGIDLTPRSIELARRRFAVYQLEADLAIGDGECLALPDESFDLVYSFGVLHHTPDTRRAGEEIHRVLKRGGRAIVMLYNRSSLYYWGGVILKRGLLRGELLRHGAAEIMSRHVEYSESDARPLVKAYSKREALRLFANFRGCSLQVQQLTRGELGFLSPLVSDRSLRWLAEHFGWNLIIEATK